MLVAEGGRAKDFLFGAKPSRSNLKKASRLVIHSGKAQ